MLLDLLPYPSPPTCRRRYGVPAGLTVPGYGMRGPTVIEEPPPVPVPPDPARPDPTTGAGADPSDPPDPPPAFPADPPDPVGFAVFFGLVDPPELFLAAFFTIVRPLSFQ